MTRLPGDMTEIISIMPIPCTPCTLATYNGKIAQELVKTIMMTVR